VDKQQGPKITPALPQVSVLLPVYNAASTLEASINSILQQSFEDWELLIVNDGSTDDCLRIIQAYAKQQSRIRLFNIAHRGLVHALNLGLEKAGAPLIARMDADDVAAPTRLAEQVAWLANRPDTGLVSSLVTYMAPGSKQETTYANPNALGYERHVDWCNTMQTHEQMYAARFTESPLPHPSVMFRANLVSKYGGYDNGPFPEDYELWLRWLEAGVKMEKVPSHLLSWYDYSLRLSRSNAMYSQEAFYKLKAFYWLRWYANFGQGRPVWVWGHGKAVRQKCQYLAQAWIEAPQKVSPMPNTQPITIHSYIDVRTPRPQSKYNVVHYNDLPAAGSSIILSYVGDWKGRVAIRQHLLQKGYVEGQDFFMMA